MNIPSLANPGNNQVFFAVINRRFSIIVIREGRHVISFPSHTNCRRLLIEKRCALIINRTIQINTYFSCAIPLGIVVRRLYEISKCRRLIKPNKLSKETQRGIHLSLIKSLSTYREANHTIGKRTYPGKAMF